MRLQRSRFEMFRCAPLPKIARLSNPTPFLHNVGVLCQCRLSSYPSFRAKSSNSSPQVLDCARSMSRGGLFTWSRNQLASFPTPEKSTKSSHLNCATHLCSRDDPKFLS